MPSSLCRYERRESTKISFKELFVAIRFFLFFWPEFCLQLSSPGCIGCIYWPNIVDDGVQESKHRHRTPLRIAFETCIDYQTTNLLLLQIIWVEAQVLPGFKGLNGFWLILSFRIKCFQPIHPTCIYNHPFLDAVYVRKHIL